MNASVRKRNDWQDDSSAGHPPGWLAWSMWGLAALLYLYSFYQRVAPAVMTAELMNDFGIGAAALGNLSALFFYSYVAMQVPTGLMADKWGPRRLLTAGAFVAAVGTMIFAWSEDLRWAGLGRLLIGGSTAVAYVVMLKLAGNWFKPRLFALASGLALFFGVLGAVTAGTPLRLLVDRFGWRPIMLVSGGVTLVIGALIWLFIRDDPSQRGFRSYASSGGPASAARVGFLAGLRRMMGFRNPWLLSLAPGAMGGSVMAFAGLWGVPFLKVRYGLAPAQGAAVCSALMVSWALGGPVLGGLSDRIGRRKPLYLGGGLTAAVGWAAMIFWPDLPLGPFVGVGLIASFACGAIVIGFAFAKESVPIRYSGTVVGVVNMGVMMGTAILQPAIGWVLDANWQGLTADGVRVYDLAAYRLGFSLMLAWLAAACVMLGLTKETHCRQLP